MGGYINAGGTVVGMPFVGGPVSNSNAESPLGGSGGLIANARIYMPVSVTLSGNGNVNPRPS